MKTAENCLRTLLLSIFYRCCPPVPGSRARADAKNVDFRSTGGREGRYNALPLVSLLSSVFVDRAVFQAHTQPLANTRRAVQDIPSAGNRSLAQKCTRIYSYFSPRAISLANFDIRETSIPRYLMPSCRKEIRVSGLFINRERDARKDAKSIGTIRMKETKTISKL